MVGLWSNRCVSHRTNLFFPLLNGSLNKATGWRYTSLFEPSAWFVLEPSKFQMGRSSGLVGSSLTVLVLQRRCSPVPSTQMYMAWMLSPWSRDMYLASIGLLLLSSIALLLEKSFLVAQTVFFSGSRRRLRGAFIQFIFETREFSRPITVSYQNTRDRTRVYLDVKRPFDWGTRDSHATSNFTTITFQGACLIQTTRNVLFGPARLVIQQTCYWRSVPTIFVFQVDGHSLENRLTLTAAVFPSDLLTIPFAFKIWMIPRKSSKPFVQFSHMVLKLTYTAFFINQPVERDKNCHHQSCPNKNNWIKEMRPSSLLQESIGALTIGLPTGL